MFLVPALNELMPLDLLSKHSTSGYEPQLNFSNLMLVMGLTDFQLDKNVIADFGFILNKRLPLD